MLRNSPFRTTPTPEAQPEPFSSTGAQTDHDAQGRFTVGNRAALVAGAHSARFWDGIAGALAERSASILSDLGHDADSAPRALQQVVTGAVQAVLLRDSAFARIAESGGPTTLRGRRRAAFRIWCEASDRAERYLRLVGLSRVPRPVDPRDEIEARVAALSSRRRTP